MKTVDRDAMQRALAEYSRDPACADQIKRKRAQGDSWEECGSLASYGCQCDALHLKPWQSPPCCMSDAQPDDDGLLAAWELRRRLLALGLSAYEPDPVAALHAANEAARRA